MSFGSLTIVIPGEALAYARSGSCGVRRFTPGPQRGYMELVRLYAAREMGGREPTLLPVRLELSVEYLIPKSWTKERAERAQWKKSKPDADNLCKIVEDALSHIVYHDDAQIAALIVQKFYGRIAQSTITITEM